VPRLVCALLPALLLACGDSGESTSTSPTSPTSVSASGETSGVTSDVTTGVTSDTGELPTTGTNTNATDDPTPATTDVTTATTTNDPTSTTSNATTGDVPDTDPDPNAPPITEGDWWRPGITTTWQLQLTGDIVTDVDADLFDIDLFDTPQSTLDALHADGRKVICYFSAGSGEDWRPDYADFDPAALGKPLDGWPGEVWLDVRHPSVWAVMRGRLDRAVTAGCDGVDPDNMDGWLQDSGYPISNDDQLAYNRWLANQAHLRGLTVGLKNGGDQVQDLVDYFDFELNEQCHEYDECQQLAAFTSQGKPIFNVEYPGDEADAQALVDSLCPAAKAEQLRTLMLPYDLDGSWRVSCD
jgi:hypothetical protein